MLNPYNEDWVPFTRGWKVSLALVVAGVLIILAVFGMCVTKTLAGEIEDQCAALVELQLAYRGRTLTPDEQQIKRQLVAWYIANCKKKR